MEKISQDLTMTTLRGDTDPLRVAAANSDCSDSRPQDPLNLNTTTSELQVLVHQLERRLAHKKVDRSRYRLSSEDFARLTGEYEQKLHWQESVRYGEFESFSGWPVRPKTDILYTHTQIRLLPRHPGSDPPYAAPQARGCRFTGRPSHPGKNRTALRQMPSGVPI